MGTVANACLPTCCRRNAITLVPIPMSGWINPAVSFSIRIGREGEGKHPLPHTTSSRRRAKQKKRHMPLFLFYVMFPVVLIFDDFAVVAFGLDHLFFEIALLKNQDE